MNFVTSDMQSQESWERYDICWNVGGLSSHNMKSLLVLQSPPLWRRIWVCTKHWWEPRWMGSNSLKDPSSNMLDVFCCYFFYWNIVMLFLLSLTKEFFGQNINCFVSCPDFCICSHKCSQKCFLFVTVVRPFSSYSFLTGRRKDIIPYFLLLNPFKQQQERGGGDAACWSTHFLWRNKWGRVAVQVSCCLCCFDVVCWWLFLVYGQPGIYKMGEHQFIHDHVWIGDVSHSVSQSDVDSPDDQNFHH